MFRATREIPLPFAVDLPEKMIDPGSVKSPRRRRDTDAEQDPLDSDAPSELNTNMATADDLTLQVTYTWPSSGTNTKKQKN
jgi:hypothetical protein